MVSSQVNPRAVECHLHPKCGSASALVWLSAATVVHGAISNWADGEAAHMTMLVVVLQQERRRVVVAGLARGRQA